MRSVAVFGGSFDPVHNGHLRMALELQQALNFQQMRLLPAYCSPLKSGVHAFSEQRLHMLERAIKNCPALMLDTRELDRGQVTYTYDSLCQMREELGQDVSLTWVMGTDSLLNFDRWHHWQDFLSVANVAVVARPGFTLPNQGDVASWLAANQLPAEQLVERSCGGIGLIQQRLLPISATEIRDVIASGQSAQFLLPDAVWDYICEYRLYQTNT